MSQTMIFKPRKSNGWLFVGLLGMLLLIFGIILLLGGGATSPFMITMVLVALVGVIFLSIAAFYPAMRYEIQEDCLRINYGPWLRYTIRIEEVKKVQLGDLGLSMVSSFRFPGLVLFSVPYPEIGTVKMCATATSRSILLIETETAKYGITPADEQRFIAELNKRRRQP